MKSCGLGGLTNELFDGLLSGEAGAASRSTKDLVYGSQVVALLDGVFALMDPLACCALPTLARWGQTCVAAFDAAVGVFPRSVATILPDEFELVRSLGSLRSVRNIPPFLSGLGVLDPFRGCSPGRGTKFGELE